jgi:hypothetical protein
VVSLDPLCSKLEHFLDALEESFVT